MIVQRPVIGLVLATFVAMVAVPGPHVVAHRHADGEHAHVHGHAAADHHHPHPHDHDHHGSPEPKRLPGDGIVAWDGTPGEHVHVLAPFQPATATRHAPIVRVALVTPIDAGAPVAPLAPPLRSDRSRGPPASRHV